MAGITKSQEDDAMRRRINDQLEDNDTNLRANIDQFNSRRNLPRPPMIKREIPRNYGAERDLQRGDYDAAPPMPPDSGRKPDPMGYRKGGMVKAGSPTCCPMSKGSKQISCS